MYFLAGHRNYSFVLTKASAVDKCNKAELSELSVRYEKWTQAVSDYDDYKQYQPVMKEYQALSGLRKNSFKKKHETELENYAIYRDRVKAVMPENMKISKPYIDKQLAEVLAQQEQIQRKSSRVAADLARLSVSKAISGKWKHSRERTSRQGSRTGIRNTKIQFNHSVRCMENRKDFMHLFSLGKGDLWNRQKSRQWTKNSVRISKKNRKKPPTTWQFISAKRAGKP